MVSYRQYHSSPVAHIPRSARPAERPALDPIPAGRPALVRRHQRSHPRRLSRLVRVRACFGIIYLIYFPGITPLHT